MYYSKRCLALGFIACVLWPTDVSAQNADYTVAGITAWTTAKTYGFEFAPEAASGESVTSPRDGMNTRLRKTVTSLLGSTTVTIAQVVGGQPSVNAGQRNTTFRMFSNRTLQPGWTVKSIDVRGSFTYVQTVRQGTSDLSFRVRLSPGGSATLRSLVLTGPEGANWQDAFSAPARRDYVINGIVAWNAAKKYGFEFYPYGDGETDVDRTSFPRDGVFTYRYVSKTSLIGSCTSPPNRSTSCIMAQIAGGNLSVPANPYGFTSAEFVLYRAKKLAPGWLVKSVSISSGTFIRQPAYGTDDMSFALRLQGSAAKPATGTITSITLEGPSNAASFEDAFKFGQ